MQGVTSSNLVVSTKKSHSQKRMAFLILISPRIIRLSQQVINAGVVELGELDENGSGDGKPLTSYGFGYII